ncbi:hypothetical protein PLESTB_000465300 [Pleodorina starrii]|uniref:RWP-RK domain-containing protein n=1 Tax=Pleodorina starrii TaxID=330485 RepID=A0A9W6BFD2_9CHLO|nr:hypothetical protein PLESTB_000465300 [Pleodorina starrii]
MESNHPGHFSGADGGADATLAGVATTNASLAPGGVQLSIPGDASPTAAAGPLTFGIASLPPGLMQMDPSSLPALSCAMASDGAPQCGQPELLRSLVPSDSAQASMKSLWRAQNELLPPARLVEVAHAALQSSGFRRRPAPGTQQQSEQDAQLVAYAAASATAEVERSSSAKRDPPGGNGCDSNGPQDMKRLRTDSCGDGAPHLATAEQPIANVVPDAVARIVSVSALQPPPPPVPSVKRELPPLPPLPNHSSATTPFSRPHRTRSSGSGAPEAAAAPSGDAPAAGTCVPLKSAFSHAASLPTEWQPGCSVTTGRRSARSPAPRGSRNLSLICATSAETNSAMAPRRGSGLASAQSAFTAAQAAETALAGGGAAAVAAVPAAGGAEQGVESGSVASNPGQRAGGGGGSSGAMESAASADLRRLAQLAEAAAMLEEQMATKGGHRASGGGGGGQDAGPGSHALSIPVGEDGSSRAAGAQARLGADGVEQQPMLRHRSTSLTAGGLTAGLGGVAAADLLRPPGSALTSGPAVLRSMGSLPGALPDSHAASGAADVSGRAGDMADGGGREGSPGDDDVMGGGRRRTAHMDSEAASEGGSQDGDHPDDDDDDVDGGDGSNDSAGGGSSAGGSGRTLTERYRAALKASAKQRGRGQSVVKLDPDKAPRGSNRNGLCARIASITKERLQQVYHLNIEEAARELGIGMTKLKEHCRTLGIPRWPSRKLKSMDKLIESLNERAMTEPATKEVIADILAEIESFKRAIYENPCLEVEEDIKRLRQSNFKKEYQQRQVEQRLRGGGILMDKPGGVAGGGGAGGSSGGGRTSSMGGSQHFQGGCPSGGGLSAASINAATSAASGAAALAQAALSQPVLPQGVLPPSFTANLGPALMAGQLAAGAAAAQGSAHLVQVPLLAPGQLQQLLMAQQPAALQQLMAQRALVGMPPSALLLPAMIPPQLQQQQPQLTKPVEALAAMGEAGPDAE